MFSVANEIKLEAGTAPFFPILLQPNWRSENGQNTYCLPCADERDATGGLAFALPDCCLLRWVVNAYSTSGWITQR